MPRALSSVIRDKAPSGHCAAAKVVTRGRRRRPGEKVFMANVVVVGSQWGDEGKGKIVDWLSEQADVVVQIGRAHV